MTKPKRRTERVWIVAALDVHSAGMTVLLARIVAWLRGWRHRPDLNSRLRVLGIYAAMNPRRKR